MRAVEIIKSAVEQITEIKDFVSSTRFIQNAESDNGIAFPCAYLDRPLVIGAAPNAQGTIIERPSISMLFADVCPLLDSIKAQEQIDIIVEVQRILALRFYDALIRDRENISSINNYQITEFFGEYDVNVAGVFVQFQLTLRVENPYPCAYGDPS